MSFSWVANALDVLEGQKSLGYETEYTPSVEPSTYVCMALCSHGRTMAAKPILNWLRSVQSIDGSLSIDSSHLEPKWPTALAVLSWLSAETSLVSRGSETLSINDEVKRAVASILRTWGGTAEKDLDIVGHDTTLKGWPWAQGSHSWVEPTAMSLLALKAVGLRKHERAREAVRLLIDRLLPDGGCNYGSTTVLGRSLKPQIAPTGISLLALAGETDLDGRIHASLDYLKRQLSIRTPTYSLCYGLMGLAAWDRFPIESDSWLEASYRETDYRSLSPLLLALLSLAVLGASGPLISLSSNAQDLATAFPVCNYEHNKRGLGRKVNQSCRISDSDAKNSGELKIRNLPLLQLQSVRTSIKSIFDIGWRLEKTNCRQKSTVFIARNQHYNGDLAKTIEDGFLTVGLSPSDARGRRFLLKPNLVDPVSSATHITTNPSVLLAVAEVLLRWGADVVVGEASGLVRDTNGILIESGLKDALRHDNLRFIDLNYDETTWTINSGKTSRLKGFYVSSSVIAADFVVSIPKLKTHHWIGVTAAMKNLYGVLPGTIYGWPKNVLHHMGIAQTVYDLYSSLPKTITVVDAIDCMEGDGPIMGTPKHLGLLVIGTQLSAVDSTCARIMGLDPSKIEYLRIAGKYGSSIYAQDIEQRGEQWKDVFSPFKLLDLYHLQKLRDENCWR